MTKARQFTDDEHSIMRQAYDGLLTIERAAQTLGCSEETIRRYWRSNQWWTSAPKPPDAVVPDNSRWVPIAFNATGKAWLLMPESPYTIAEAMGRAAFGLGYTMHRRARGGRELVYTDRVRA